jgi:transglutaminase-like putative cysteine protease
VASLRERVFYPKAGWLSLGLLLVMVLALSWSVQGARWLDQLEFLPPVAMWAILAGALLGILPLGIVVALPAAAVIGAAIVVWTIGGEYHTALDQGGRLVALRDDVLGWTVTLLRTGYPIQLTPYALGLGALLWSTAFISAFAVYRHNRVIDAIMLTGAAMVVNLSATYEDLLAHLILFVIAALLLWLRAVLVDRQDGWQRRRVNENLEVPAAIMRTGIIFGGASVMLALVLTSVAVASPLTNAWRSFDGLWTSVRDSFEGAFGTLTNPNSRITGNSFGNGFTVQGEWVSADDEAITLAATRPLYLRTATYDEYTGRGFQRSESTRRLVTAGDPLFEELTSEWPELDAFTLERIAIRMHQTIGRNIFTAGAPLEIYAPAYIHQPGGAAVLGGLEALSPIGEGQGYQLSVAISNASAAQLAAAGTEYPPEVVDLYLDTPGLTDRVAEAARQVTEGAANPYEQAALLARFLHSDDSFTYATQAPRPSPDQDLVDFFLFDPTGRTGYCQYYATAMVVMARSLGLPARVAVGFAPGDSQEDGTYLYRESDAHAWAEIYFPGYGWEIFEPTKGISPQFTRVRGDPDAARPPRLDDPLRDFEFEDIREGGPAALPSFAPAEGAVDPSNPNAPVDGSASGGNALVIGILVLGAATYIFIRFRTLQRRWRLLPAGDRAWQRLSLAANRAGIGPRPSETIYEYSGWLEDQLPRHVEPIRTVADAKVWQAYSGRRMSLSATERLERAWERLRLPMLWLGARRWLRNLMRRSS